MDFEEARARYKRQLAHDASITGALLADDLAQAGDDLVARARFRLQEIEANLAAHARGLHRAVDGVVGQAGTEHADELEALVAVSEAAEQQLRASARRELGQLRAFLRFVRPALPQDVASSMDGILAEADRIVLRHLGHMRDERARLMARLGEITRGEPPDAVITNADELHRYLTGIAST